MRVGVEVGVGVFIGWAATVNTQPLLKVKVSPKSAGATTPGQAESASKKSKDRTVVVLAGTSSSGSLGPFQVVGEVLSFDPVKRVPVSGCRIASRTGLPMPGMVVPS